MAQNKREERELLDIRKIINDYIANWWLFAVCTVCCVALAFVYVKVRTPKYEIKANILIDSDDQGSNIMAGLGDLGGLFGSSSAVDDEIFIVSSHSLLREVVRDLQLNRKHIVKENLLKKVFRYDDYPIDVTGPAGIADTLRVPITFYVKAYTDGDVTVKTVAGKIKLPKVKAKGFPVNVTTPYGEFVVNKTSHFPADEDVKSTITFDGYDNAAENIAEDISIYLASKKANAIALSLISTDPEYAKDVLNTIISHYNQRGIDEKNLKTQKTAQFIDQRLKLLSDDLSDTEHSIETYKKNNNITDVEIETGYQLKKRGEIDAMLVEAETQLQIVKTIRDFIADPANDYSLVPLTTVTADAAEAIKAYNELVLRRIEMVQTAREGSLSLKAIDSQLKAMRKNIDVSLDKAYESSLLAVNELKSEVNSTDSKLGKIPTVEREYRVIKRQQAIKEQLYVFLLQRREESAMMLANSIPKGTIVDKAYSVNEPLGMKNIVVLLVAFAFGLCLAPVILYVKGLLKNKFSNREEVEAATDIPVLGEVTTSQSPDKLIVRPGSKSSTAELFRLIRSNLQFMLNRKDEKVVLVTSTVSGEGKTFVSTNLASVFALDKKRVLLVGLDIRNPKIAEYLSVNPRHGITDYLSDSALTADDIIISNPLGNGLDIVTAGPIPPNPAELLNESRLDEFFALMRQRYDTIFVDSAPVGMVSDTFALDRIIDATVYVCRADYTTTKEIDFFNRLYEECRLKKIGIVVNGTKARKGYGYGYGQTNE